MTKRKHVKIRRKACTAKLGRIFAAERGRLPDAAYGLPSRRKYPLYRVAGNRAIASRSHAVTAKGRALQQLGHTIDAREYATIIRRADRVIRLCDA